MFPAVKNAVSVVLSHQNPLICLFRTGLDLLSGHISLLIQTRLLFHWRKQYCGCIFLLQMLNDVVLWITCGLLWCFYQLFGLSFWRHPFTAEDPLVSKWCNAKSLQICSDEETNPSTSWMTWECVKFHIWVKYSFNKYLQKTVVMLPKLLLSPRRSEFLPFWICSCSHYLNPELKSTRTTSTNISTS